MESRHPDRVLLHAEVRPRHANEPASALRQGRSLLVQQARRRVAATTGPDTKHADKKLGIDRQICRCWSIGGGGRKSGSEARTSGVRALHLRRHRRRPFLGITLHRRAARRIFRQRETCTVQRGKATSKPRPGARSRRAGCRSGGSRLATCSQHLNGVFHPPSDVVVFPAPLKPNAPSGSSDNNNTCAAQCSDAEKLPKRAKIVADEARSGACCLPAKIGPLLCAAPTSTPVPSTSCCRESRPALGGKLSTVASHLKWPLELNAEWRHRADTGDNEHPAGQVAAARPIIGREPPTSGARRSHCGAAARWLRIGRRHYADDDDDDGSCSDDNLMIDHASRWSSWSSCDGKPLPLARVRGMKQPGERAAASNNGTRSGSGRAISLSPAFCEKTTNSEVASRRLFLLLLFLCLCPLFQPSNGKAASANASQRQHFWRKLLTPLLRPQQETAQMNDNSGPATESLNRIAGQFSEWPPEQGDKSARRAALFYLDLVARRKGGPRAENLQGCRRVTFAELDSERFFALRGDDRAGNETDELARALQVARANELRAPAGLVARLRAEPRFAALARLAVENANLITRLLLVQPAESAALKGINSRQFYKFLLESKLNQSSPRDKVMSTLHSLGLIFAHPLAEGSLEMPELALEAHFRAKEDALIEDLVAWENKEGTRQNGYFGFNASDIQPFYAKWVADRQSVGFVERKLGSQLERSDLSLDSLTQSEGQWFSPYFDCGRSQKWLLTYSIPFFGRRISQADNGRAVGFRGVSFASLDLGKTQLIDQCAPGAHDADDDGEGDEGSERYSFFANTHQCARLQWSQCIRLPDFQEVRSGGYVCQCPASGQVADSEQKANEERRERLVEQLMTRASENASLYAFDQLTLDVDERLGDRSYVLGQLTRRQAAQRPPVHNQSQNQNLNRQVTTDTLHERNFALGAQLESDANLEWFSKDLQDSGREDGPSALSGPDWPKQVCRVCSSTKQSKAERDESTAPGTGLALTLNGDSDQFEDDCREGSFHPLGSSYDEQQKLNWIRPLVATVQSLCIFITLVLIGVLMRIRKSRIILASGWLMLETILIGALFLYTSVLVRYFESTSITCLVEPWLRELGFSIFYGSILIKLYKILTEFQTRKAHRVLFRDKDQLVYLLAIILIIVGYMSAWTALMIDGFFFGRQSGPASTAAAPISAEQDLDGGGQAHLASADSAPNDGSLVSSAMEQLSEFAPEQLRSLARQLNSFSNLFSGLVERHRHYDRRRDSVSFSMRCRKLTWDYVTELSEMGLLLFGINLVYKLRNASSEAHKEKLVLSGAVFIELFVSALTYTSRHLLWNRLSANQILLLYCARCQLTVSITLGLVFAPKLYLISKSRPTLFNWRGNRAVGGSTRHRCHISCELHDHHLDDAMRLHQAMLSNAALDIGSINLADMDPDEIQAELKRVYAQLEMLKTKAMRRDNPHISKRRGGRKTGHRKFSLQAFHAKHLASHHTHSNNNQQQQPSPAQQQQQPAPSLESGSNNANCQSNNKGKLPVLVEQESNQCGGRATDADEHRQVNHIDGQRATALETCNELDEHLHKRLDGSPATSIHQQQQEQPQVPSSAESQQQKLMQQPKQHRHRQHHHHHHHHHHNHKHNSQQQQQQSAGNQPSSRRTVVLAEPNSTGSTAGAIYGLNDDDTLILNDSQSSGNASLHRQSSYVCSQSSIHPEESSLN